MSRLPFVDQRAYHDAIDQKSTADYVALQLGAWEGLAIALDALQAGEPNCRGEIARWATRLLYDTVGLLHALGMDPQTLWDARHRANLAKISHQCPVCNGAGMSTDEQGAVPCTTCGSKGGLSHSSSGSAGWTS